MTTEFLGKRLSGPFTIPSGIVTTAPAIIQRVMDTMPEIGVITKADDIVCAVHAYKAGATKNVAMRFYYAGAAL